jgi:PAS domain S-box-containing protein
MSSASVRRKTRQLQSGFRNINLALPASILVIAAYFIIGSLLIKNSAVLQQFLIWGGIGAVGIVAFEFYYLYQLRGRLMSYSPAQASLSAPVKAATGGDGKFKSLIQNSMDIISILNDKGVIQYQSPSSERLLGYDPEALVGQSIFELIHAEDHALMGNVLQQRGTFFFSFRMQHHDGSWMFFDSAGTNMLQDPVIKGIVLNSRDITDRKREEERTKQKEMAAMRLNAEKEASEREKAVIEEKNRQLGEAFEKIDHQNKEIHDSINYAFRIQKAMLPEPSLIKHHLPDSFVFWRPKDIVSGDFYWYAKMENYSLLAAADCTGHGVPGAFMTMIGNTLLNQVVKQQSVLMPDEILNQLHMAVRRALKQDETGSTSRDGMDISFLVIDHTKQEAHWSGANNPLIQIRGAEQFEFKPDKQSIGGLQTEEKRVFQRQLITTKPGDIFYVYSDGFQDQFGGDKGRKYMTKRFKEFLQTLSTQPIDIQPKLLDAEITAWIGDKYEQLDDILVLGVKV